MEHADKLELFSLHLVPSSELEKPLQLAQEAVGISHLLPDDDGSFEGCSICREKHSSQILKINCSHKFCSPCLITYVQGKLQASQVPVRCSHSGCQYYISSAECQSFLPIDCYESFERTLVEAEAHRLERIRCPFLSCSAWLAPTPFSVGESSSSYSNSSCIECPECSRLVCFDCGVPWHISMTCGEYQSLPQDERDEVDITMSVITQDNNWRCCEQCRRIIERTQGCYHMTCWYGHFVE
ncbi:unnamed protein product [Spirodela intermedia]|uniref:RBR-type E3 ubiquitin transferase n=1 Tax=Spirodela intermedia TaxID=51605 RepID=A0A7I8JIZ7_SPIIN|nr:unnamed protein product [Spirodela intermedia]CAA6669891.1 unnamed protein product [Spirodela intermedia]